MRFRMMISAFLLFICATCAFAADTTVVNIPFAFESLGQHFPPSQYEVRLSDDRHHVTITSRQALAKSIFLTVSQADVTQYDPILSIRFENVGGLRELRSLRLGSYQYRY